jgi:hypothetical protein
MKKRFMAMRTSIVLYRISAWLFLILSIGIAMFFFYLSTINLYTPNIEYGGYIIPLGIVDNPIVTISAAVLSIFLGIKVFMRQRTKAEIMKAFLSIEENSRLTIELLTKTENQNDVQNFKSENEILG